MNYDALRAADKGAGTVQVEEEVQGCEGAVMQVLSSICDPRALCPENAHDNFDHHLTTTVQLPFKTPKKPVVTTNNGLFLVLAVNVQSQQN